MPKIIAIHSGGDWYDASADYLVLPEGVNLDEERHLWQRNCRGMTFTEWLMKLGARNVTDDELEVVDCT
jgi:hypothetical protein